IGAEGTTSGPERARNMSGFLGEIISNWMKQHTKAEVVEKLLAAGLPVGPVQNAQEIFNCPQIAARKLFIDIDDPVLGPIKLVGPPVKMSNHLEPIARPAPALGEHNEAILKEYLGYSPEAIEELRN